MREKGFSLVELIIVIAIMAILIGVLAPQYIKYVEKSRVSADEDSAGSLYESAHVMISDENWVDGLSDGDTISFSVNGVRASNSTIEAALDEFYAKWRSCKVRSKLYQSKSYKLTFSSSTGSLFLVEGSWN